MPLPSAISSKFVGHWDYSNPANLTTVSDKITVLNDLIGSNDLIPEPAKSGPDYATTMGPNGLRCATFNNTDKQLLETAAGVYAISHPFEVWLTFVFDSNIDVSSMWLFAAESPVHSLHASISGSGKLSMVSGGVGKNGNAFTTAQHGVVQVCRCLFKDNGGAFESEIYLNEVPWGIAGQDIGSSDIEEIAFGSLIGGTGGIAGRMGEYAIADDELDATELAAMWDYVRRWTVPFGKGVTFDTARPTVHGTTRETTLRF